MIFKILDSRDPKKYFLEKKSKLFSLKRKKTIYYDKAIIKVYDIPIFFIPKLSHPDPSVERRSGFLIPSFADSKNLGASFDVPYYWALNKDYGLSNIQFSGPVFKSLEIKKNKLVLKFDYATNGLYCPDGVINNFELAGKDKVFYPANAKIMWNQLEVKSDKVKNPVHVRYGWKNYLKGNLYNTKGLPASSFRTDSW